LFVLHFRNQRECEAAIWQVAAILQVPRVTLGLSASSKGWYCGSLQIVSSHDGSITDTQNVTSVEGQPITREWLQWKLHDGDFDIQTTAKCIIVVEKEGIYKRLCEDRFFDRIPCIIVTGKGVPDLATRAFVHTMHIAFGNLPVYGVCNCNPYGVGVL
jgi:meiotic recombination protein SPO11